MRCRSRFHRRPSDRRYPPRTVRYPSPTHLRRAERDATRCLAQLERRRYAVSSKWSELPRPTWVQCTAGDCCAATTSRCALDTARPQLLWFHSWHYRLVPFIILPVQYTVTKIFYKRTRYNDVKNDCCSLWRPEGLFSEILIYVSLGFFYAFCCGVG